jgi:hypothetical protein
MNASDRGIGAVVARWHDYLRGDAPDALDELLDEDVVFYSPIVFTPQRGKQVTTLYLQAAGQTFAGGEPVDAAGPRGGDAGGDVDRDRGRDGRFRYTKTVLGDDTAVLEFETTMGGKYVNGVDIIRCNDDGRIVEFRVMIRPLQAVNLVHEQMAAMLERMAPPG